MKTLIIGYRANTDDEERGRKRPFLDSSSAAVLDKFAPGWRKMKTANLLWSRSDETDPSSRAAALNRRADRLVLCGRDVARAFGLNRLKWFTFYETADGKTVVMVPHPSPRNRMWNDRKTQRKMKALFEELSSDG